MIDLLAAIFVAYNNDKKMTRRMKPRSRQIPHELATSLKFICCQSMVSRTSLVDANFGKKDFVQKTHLSSRFFQRKLPRYEIQNFLHEKHHKKLRKRLQQITFVRTVLFQTQTKQLSGHRSTNNFIPVCSYSCIY